MDINEYKAALKNIIDATNDEDLLKNWRTHLEKEFEQHQQRASKAQETDRDDNEGYVILESGLGIDE